MGKRQLGELQPVEFVITLIAAELACVPMQDISTPIMYGFIPILVIFAAHFLISSLSTKSIPFRKFINGKPVIIINENGLDYNALKQLNMNVCDILESLRDRECFSIEQVNMALIETTGKLTVLKNNEVSPPRSLPITLVLEGKFLEENARFFSLSKSIISLFLSKHNLKIEDILLLTLEKTKVFVQPKFKRFFSSFLESFNED
ncbi:MAG: DUF421 domain-containing protein [Christensenellaceae bacterium]|nr:DUF421 domain-containing protein [Christensenellaceae bacterium]